MHLSLKLRETALIMASKEGHIECVQVLLDKGSDVNMQDKVSGVIIYTVYMQCSMYPESQYAVVSEDVHKNPIVCIHG